MSDFDERLNSILSDPETMAQLAAIAQSLTAPSPDGAQSAAPAPPAEQPNAPQGAASDAAAMLGGLDPELLRRLAPIMREMNRPESGETAAFLRALRPFLSETRREKVERAAQLARLLHLGKSFLVSQGGSERV